MRFRKKHYAIPEMEKSPHVVLDVNEMLAENKTWSDFFMEPNQDFILELGLGKGKFITSMALRHPELNFIAVDIEANAMIAAKRTIDEKKIKNVLLLRHDITLIDGIFPEDFFSRVYIHFPNPWPKKRHYKRRLTHPRQLIQYHSFLQDDAQVFFKTDDFDLYVSSVQYFTQFAFSIQEMTQDLSVEDDPTGIITEYEARWRGQGIPIKAILAKKEKVAPEVLQERLVQFLEEEKNYKTKNQNT